MTQAGIAPAGEGLSGMNTDLQSERLRVTVHAAESNLVSGDGIEPPNPVSRARHYLSPEAVHRSYQATTLSAGCLVSEAIA